MVPPFAMPDYSYAPPPLALSDIMHTMSPSPGPSTQQDGIQSSADEPEPFNQAAIAQLRQRLSDMGVLSDISDMSPREKELADMVLRLTESPFPDPTQLVTQAEIISNLLVERSHLLQDHADERSRWASQWDSWNRMAEALIAQRARASASAPRNEELERQCAVLDSDNRFLRDKLQDTQSRLSSLEAELTKLRPLLLLQPFSNLRIPSSHHASGFLSSLPFPSLSHNHTRSRPPKRKVKEISSQHTAASIPQANEHDSREASTKRHSYDVNPGTPVDRSGHLESLFAPTATHPQNATIPPTPKLATPGPTNQPGSSSARHPRPSQSQSSFSPLRTRQTFNTLSSDARVEHLLLAARKLGRERTALVTGFIRERQKHLSKGTDLDKDRLPTTFSTPATPLNLLLTPSTPLSMAPQQHQPMSSISYYRKESPRTPKRTSSHYSQPTQTSAQNRPSDPSVFATSSSAPPPPSTLVTPARAESLPNMPVPQSQAQQSSSTRRPGGGEALRISTQAPPTPLDSLLSAARSMMDDGTNEPQQNMPKRHAGAQEPESPLPKRRRVSQLGSGGSLLERNKEKSALDVLADQAAVYGSSAESPGELGGQENRSTKGKEKERDVREVSQKGEPDLEESEDARRPASAETATTTTKHTESVANDQLGDAINPTRNGRQRQPRAKTTLAGNTRNKAPVSNIPTARSPQHRRQPSSTSPQEQTTVEPTSSQISQPVDVVVAGTPLRESRRRNTLPASASGQQQQAEPLMSFGRKRGETWNNFSPEDIARSGSGSGSQTGQGTSRRTSARAKKSAVRVRKGGDGASRQVINVKESATRSTVEEAQGVAAPTVGHDQPHGMGLETQVGNEERANQNDEYPLTMAIDAVRTTMLSSVAGDHRESVVAVDNVVPDVVMEIESNITNPPSFGSGPHPLPHSTEAIDHDSSLSPSIPQSTPWESHPVNATVTPLPLHDSSDLQEAPLSATTPSGGESQSHAADQPPPSVVEVPFASAQNVFDEIVVHEEAATTGEVMGELPEASTEVGGQINRSDEAVMDVDAEGDAGLYVDLEAGDDSEVPSSRVVFEADQTRSRDEDEESDRDGEGDLDADAEGDEDLGLDGEMTPLQYGVEDVHPEIEPFFVGDEFFISKRGTSQGFLEGISGHDQDPFFVHPNIHTGSKDS